MEAGFKSRKQITKGQDIDVSISNSNLKSSAGFRPKSARHVPSRPCLGLFSNIHLDIVTAAVCHRQDFVTPHRVVQLA